MSERKTSIDIPPIISATRTDTSGLINLKNQVIPDEFFAATLKQAEFHTALEEFINAMMATGDSEKLMGHLEGFKEDLLSIGFMEVPG